MLSLFVRMVLIGVNCSLSSVSGWPEEHRGEWWVPMLDGSVCFLMGLFYYLVYKGVCRTMQVVIRRSARRPRGGGGGGSSRRSFVIEEEQEEGKLSTVREADEEGMVGDEEEEEDEQDEQDEARRRESKRGEQLFTTDTIWTNVYGMGVGVFLLIVELQFNSVYNMCIMSIVFMCMGYAEEPATRGWARIPVQAMTFVGCFLSSMLLLSGGLVRYVMAGPTLYATVLNASEFMHPVAMPVLLWCIQRPRNVRETIETSLPCTGLLAFMTVLFGSTFVLPCNTLAPWMQGSQPQTDVVVLQADTRWVLTLLLSPVYVMVSMFAVLGAVFSRRSLDVACVVSVCAAIRGRLEAQGDLALLADSSIGASVCGLAALFLFRWFHDGGLEEAAGASKRPLAWKRDARRGAVLRGLSRARHTASNALYATMRL